MKKLLIALTLVAGLFTTAFAGDEKIDARVLESFHKKFAQADQISWKTQDDYYKATFTMGGNWLDAYYTRDGKLFSVTRNISAIQLPLVLLNNLKSKYEGYWITGLFEVSTETGFTYFATIENTSRKVILKSFYQNWETYEITKKNK